MTLSSDSVLEKVSSSPLNNNVPFSHKDGTRVDDLAMLANCRSPTPCHQRSTKERVEDEVKQICRCGGRDRQRSRDPLIQYVYHNLD